MHEPGRMSLGKLAVLLVLSAGDEEQRLVEKASLNGYKVYKGRVGSMDSAKIFAAVETAAKKEGFISGQYREEHALYHSILEAYHGICRGPDGLGNVLRSAGLLFAIVRGPRLAQDTGDGQWISVALYGNMGAPVKGYEHEVLGLGMNPV